MVLTLKKIVSQASRLGVTPELTPSFAKRIILTNLLGWLFVVNMSVSAVTFLYFGWTYFALFTFFFVLTEATWPILNHYRMYNFSRLGLLVSSNILGFCVSVLLPDTGYNRGFYVMAGIPVLLFDISEKKSMALGFILPLVLYPLSEWAQHELMDFGITIALQPHVTTFISYAIGLVYVVLIFVMFYFLSRESQRAEENLFRALMEVKKVHVELEDQRSRSFSSAKFAALGEMAGGIAHEINNPITVISLSVEKLQRTFKNEKIENKEAENALQTILRTVHRVAKLIDSMRGFARDASRDSCERESIRKIIEDTLTFCTERFRVHNINLIVNVPEQEIEVYCNSIQISQVLLNLLNNAFDAVEGQPNKWVEIFVSLKSEHKTVRITVTDNGVGIPKEIRDKIFLPFFTTKPVGKGTGLGLSVSKKIVEDHGGVLYLDSNADKTKFVIELPT